MMHRIPSALQYFQITVEKKKDLLSSFLNSCKPIVNFDMDNTDTFCHLYNNIQVLRNHL